MPLETNQTNTALHRKMCLPFGCSFWSSPGRATVDKQVHATSMKNSMTSMLVVLTNARMKSCLNSFGSTGLEVGRLRGNVTSTRPAFPRGKSPRERPGACKAKTIKRIRSMLRGSISEMLKTPQLHEARASAPQFMQLPDVCKMKESWQMMKQNANAEIYEIRFKVQSIITNE